jgi:hypothetical protein
MTSIVDSLVADLDDSPVRLGIIGMRMRNYVGKMVYTVHTGQYLTYEVVGTTFSPIADIVVNMESMEEFYRRNYEAVLRHNDLPAFVCRGSQLIAPELCYEKL